MSHDIASSAVATAQHAGVLADLGCAMRVHYGARLVKLVLFGSRARGDAGQDSDFDVLVVLRGRVNPREERRAVGDAIYQVCWEHDAVISCHFVPVDRFDHERSPLFLNARREGILLPA